MDFQRQKDEGCSEKEYFEKLESKKYVIDEVDEIYFFELKCGRPTMESGPMKAGLFFLNLFDSLNQIDN